MPRCYCIRLENGDVVEAAEDSHIGALALAKFWRDEGKRENLRKPVSKAAAAKQALALRLQGPDGSEGCSESESSEGEDPTQLVVGTSEGFESDAVHDLCTEDQALAVPETQEQDLTAQEATELDSLDWNSELPSDDDATQLEVPLRSGRGTSKRAAGDVGGEGGKAARRVRGVPCRRSSGPGGQRPSRGTPCTSRPLTPPEKKKIVHRLTCNTIQRTAGVSNISLGVVVLFAIIFFLKRQHLKLWKAITTPTQT
jgi:hypothetical protein